VSVLLITGPPASGKNTIGETIARRRPHCAAIDVDLIRQMITPQRNPWEGEEGRRQQDLAVYNAATLARNFHQAGYDSVISDVVTESSLDQYRKELKDTVIYTVLLLPSEDEISARMLSRPDYLSRGEMSPVYDQQAQFLSYDARLDNTEMSSDEGASWVLDRWNASIS
jgi:adenylate kinase family enzyme